MTADSTADVQYVAHHTTATLLHSKKIIRTSSLVRFGDPWTRIRPLVREEGLYQLVLARREEIHAIKELWKERVHLLEDTCLFFARARQILQEGSLVPTVKGIGAAYFLLDKTGQPQFIVKPIDEDIFCLNNRKNHASPYNDAPHRTRPRIPLYRSHQTDILASRVAEIIGMQEVTPTTSLSIVRSQDFYDISDSICAEDRSLFLKTTGEPDREKLCSLQEYFPHEQDLRGLSDEWLDLHVTEWEIARAIDQTSFEEVTFFIWLLYDNDAHGGNILVYIKNHTQEGKPIYGLKKIDNGLSFPEKNDSLVNLLAFLPNAHRPLSERMQERIRTLPIQQLIDEIKNFDLHSTIPAFLERVETLQELATRNLTIYEIDLRLSALELPEGRKIALSSISLDKLEEMIDALHPEDSSCTTSSSEVWSNSR